MQNSSIPKLGNVSAVTIAAPNLEISLSFYQKLGFNELHRADTPVPWIQITDGALLIMLITDNNPYIALTYYVNDIDNVVAFLESEGIECAIKPEQKDMIKRCLMKSPDGMNVALVGFAGGFEQPSGPTMLTMAPSDFANPGKYANKICGIFGELALPVKDIDKSLTFWEKLGFKVLSRSMSPYPWAIISDGLSIVGLHATTNFSNPSLTFFAADMKDKIEHLKKLGLKDFSEQGGQSSVVLKTPENQNINLFKLGM